MLKSALKGQVAKPVGFGIDPISTDRWSRAGKPKLFRFQVRFAARLPSAKRVGFNYNRKSLLLIAGVSGSGKSTFIRELLRSGLTSDITSALPRDISDWSVVHGREYWWLGRPLRRRASSSRGQILHLEITEALRPERTPDASKLAPELCSVRNEALLRRRLAAAKDIQVVMVSAATDQIIRQLSIRSILLHVPKFLRPVATFIAPLLLRLEASLPNQIALNAGRLLGHRWRHRAQIRARHDRLIAFYAEPGSIEAVGDAWLATLFEECADRIRSPILFVEPVPARGLRRRFRLLRRHTNNGLNESAA